MGFETASWRSARWRGFELIVFRSPIGPLRGGMRSECRSLGSRALASRLTLAYASDTSRSFLRVRNPAQGREERLASHPSRTATRVVRNPAWAGSAENTKGGFVSSGGLVALRSAAPT